MKKELNRRDALKMLMGIGASAVTLGSWRSGYARTGFPNDFLLEERRIKRMKVRNLIMNNDGDDVLMGADSVGTTITPEAFLNMRTSRLYSSLVDCIFYSTGTPYVYSHESTFTEQSKNARAQNTIKCFREIETDTLSIMINWCRQYNKEVFWSMRMNDHHDVSNPELFSQLKTDHPEYLVGMNGVNNKVMPTIWSPFNYNLPEVRKIMLDIFTDVVSRYDVDGIELDFFRHPHFFKEQFEGKSIKQEQCDLMTQLIRDMRTVCDTYALDRGKAILISVRLPDSVGFCKAIGLDLITWLQEDLIDLLVGTGYFKLEPWENWVALGRQFNVPVYAALERARLDDGRDIIPDIWRGEAYLAWKAGVNGIYTFNLFNSKSELFWQLGSYNMLKSLSKIENIAFTSTGGYEDPGYWVTDGRSHETHVVTSKKDMQSPNIVIYPNPAKDYIVINQIPAGNFEFEVHDLIGKKYKLSHITKVNQVIVNTTQLKAGVYVLKITYEDKSVITDRFIVEK